MMVNDAVGLKYQRKLNKDVHWFVDANVLRYIETSDSKLYPEKQGLGYYANLGFANKGFHIMMSYWQGNHFISPGGTQIYQSRSSIDAANYERNRQLFFMRFIYNKSLYQSPVMASARFEPIYDFNNGVFDFSFSLYLSYRVSYGFGKR
jgi:hypothetical protein